MDPILSELFTMSHPSWVALQGMVHSFTELDKAVLHVTRLVSFLWLWFSVCPLMKDKRLMEASEWRNWTREQLGLVLMGGAMLSKTLIQFSVDMSCFSSLLFQFSSVAQYCQTLCDPMNRSMPCLPVHHHLPEFTQTHAHWVSDAIQPSHPLSSASPPAPNPSQHERLFQGVNSLHEVAKVLEFQPQHQSVQWTPRTDIL